MLIGLFMHPIAFPLPWLFPSQCLF
uniref:Uncharacterized protein n=1 Tax=Rhizophora mucronata TaxID=61149 RepID=A0A2P2IN40_RHIMU